MSEEEVVVNQETPAPEAPQAEQKQSASPPPQADAPRAGRPQGDRPQGDRPQGDRPQGSRPPGTRPPQGGSPQGTRPPQGDRGPIGDRGAQGDRGARGPRPEGNRGSGSDRGPRPGGDRGPQRFGDFAPDIDLEKLIVDALYLDNQAHAVVARLRDMDSGTKSQLRRFYNAVRRACRTVESERQHEFVMLRARLAYTIARHGLRSLDVLERLLLQVTRKNDQRGYERFRDLFEAIVAYNE